MNQLHEVPPARRLDAAEIGALSHLWRGEVYRSTVWRVRFDTTTNWAVVTTGIAFSASFAPALLDKGIASTRRELERWWKDGVTDQELAARKQGLVGSYLVGLSTTTGLANAILTDVQRGYDVSRLETYPGVVKALTRDQVNSAIKKHLEPSMMVLVKAGSVATAAH